MAEPQIRQMMVADAALYRKLRLKALKEAPRAFGSDFERENSWPSEHFVERVTPSDGRCVFGAFDGARLAGCLAFARDTHAKSKHIANFFGLYVDPSYRGRGIGAALIERAVTKARATPGVTQVELAVAVDNLPALHLYEKAGFAPWGRHPSALIVDGEAVDEYAMLLDVTGALSERPS